MPKIRKARPDELPPMEQVRALMAAQHQRELHARPAVALVRLVEALVGELRAAYAEERRLRAELVIARAQLLREKKLNGTPFEEAA